MVDDKTTKGNKKDSERFKINGDNSNDPQYELIDVLSANNSNAGPPYALLETSTNAYVIGQSLSDGATYLQLTDEEDAGQF